MKDVGVAPAPSSCKSSLPKAKVPGKLSKYESAELQKAMHLKHTIVKLRTRLRCQLCRGALCVVDPRTGRHVRCSHEMITLWAKQIVRRIFRQICGGVLKMPVRLQSPILLHSIIPRTLGYLTHLMVSTHWQSLASRLTLKIPSLMFLALTLHVLSL